MRTRRKNEDDDDDATSGDEVDDEEIIRVGKERTDKADWLTPGHPPSKPDTDCAIYLLIIKAL